MEMNNPKDKNYLTYSEIKTIKERINSQAKSEDYEIKLGINTIFPKINLKKLSKW